MIALALFTKFSLNEYNFLVWIFLYGLENISFIILFFFRPVKDDAKKEESFRFDDSMDTMDLYRLFENKDGCGTESAKMEKIYYNPSSEERERLIERCFNLYFNITLDDKGYLIQFHSDQFISSIFEQKSLFN